MDLSNCITDEIAICINDNVGMQSAYLCFNVFPYFLRFLSILMYSKLCRLDNLHMPQIDKRPMSKLYFVTDLIGYFK